MNKTIEFCMTICIIVYSIILYKAYLIIFFKKSSDRNKYLLGWMPFVAWQVMINFGFSHLLLSFKLLMTIFTTVFVCLVAYNGNKWRKLIFSLVFLSLWMLTEAAVWFWLGDISKFYDLVVSVLSKSLLLLIILGLGFYLDQKEDANEINKNGKSLVVVPIGSIILCYAVMEIGLEAGTEKIKVKVFLIIGVSLLILANVGLYVLYKNLEQEKELAENTKRYLAEIDNYKQMDSLLQEVRTTKHDFKHQLLYLQELAAAEHNQKFQEVFERVEEESLKKGKISSMTGNLAVDCIINNKEKLAKKYGIRFQAQINIPEKLNIDDIDLCVLLGNGLDNAIEASALVNETEKSIDIQITYKKGFLEIEIKNKYQGDVEWIEKGRQLKSKKKEEHHGFGINSMKKIAEKYHGDIMIVTQENFFILSISLYG